MVALLILQGMPASQLGTVRRIAVCKVNGCTDPSLPWQAKPNRRSIHSIGIFSPRQELSPLMALPPGPPDPYHRVREVEVALGIMGTSIPNPTKMAPLQGHRPLCRGRGYKESESDAPVQLNSCSDQQKK